MHKISSTSSQDSEKTKHVAFNIVQKVDVLRTRDWGTLIKRLSDEFVVGISTFHDIKKQREQLLKAFAYKYVH
jgi:hypothetical protein